MSFTPRLKLSLPQLPKPALILGFGAVAVFAVATLKPKPMPLPAEPIPAPSVNVWLAQPQSKTLNVISQGTVAPKREIELVAEVAGRIVSSAANFVDGGFARQGSTLVQVDPRDYELALIQAEARVKDAEQLLATERGRARQAKREWRDLGNAEANELFLRKPQLAASEAKLKASKADRDKAKLNLERSTISLPFDGRVRTTRVNLGQYVTPGTPIAQVFDTQVAQIRLPLTDRQAALIDLPTDQSLQPGGAEPAKVTISALIAGQRHQWQGQLVRTEASIDTRSRLYYVVAEIDSPFTATVEQPTPLIAGLFVEAEIEGRALNDIVELPKSALFKRNHLYTLDEQQIVRLLQVDVLHSDREHVWVRGQLPADTPIVIEQQNNLSEGLVVKPISTEPPLPPSAQVATNTRPGAQP